MTMRAVLLFIYMNVLIGCGGGSEEGNPEETTVPISYAVDVDLSDHTHVGDLNTEITGTVLIGDTVETDRLVAIQLEYWGTTYWLTGRVGAGSDRFAFRVKNVQHAIIQVVGWASGTGLSDPLIPWDTGHYAGYWTGEGDARWLQLPVSGGMRHYLDFRPDDPDPRLVVHLVMTPPYDGG